MSFQDGITGAEDGCLVITTRKEQYIDRDYTSGRIRTDGKASWGLGLSNTNNTPLIMLYPNPANNLLSLQINDNKEYSVRIVDLTGRKVLSTYLNKSGVVDISGIKTGEYIVLISDGKLTISKKIIKK